MVRFDGPVQVGEDSPDRTGGGIPVIDFKAGALPFAHEQRVVFEADVSCLHRQSPADSGVGDQL